MPERCFGPDGVLSCPNGDNVATNLCNGDMMLCKDCKKTRFAKNDETNVKTATCRNEQIIVDEMLCFVSNKLDILKEDVIVQLCLQHFSDCDIDDSKRRLFKSCNAESKLKGHRGNGKARKNIEDVISLLLELGGNIPTFVAKDLNKLPPLTFDAVDLTTLLNSISKTKAEVDQLKESMKIQCEVTKSLSDSAAHIHQRVTNLEHAPTVTHPDTFAAKVKENISTHKNHANRQNSRAATNQIENAQAMRPQPNMNTHSMSTPRNNHVPESTQEDWTVVQANKRNPTKFGVVGTSKNSALKTVKKMVRPRTANVFAFRFDPDTTPEEIKSYLDEVLNVETQVQKVETRFDTYASFHIECVCADPEKFMDENVWPSNVFVRWWRNKKSTTTPDNDS